MSTDYIFNIGEEELHVAHGAMGVHHPLFIILHGLHVTPQNEGIGYQHGAYHDKEDD